MKPKRFRRFKPSGLRNWIHGPMEDCIVVKARNLTDARKAVLAEMRKAGVSAAFDVDATPIGVKPLTWLHKRALRGSGESF